MRNTIYVCKFNKNSLLNESFEIKEEALDWATEHLKAEPIVEAVDFDIDDDLNQKVFEKEIIFDHRDLNRSAEQPKYPKSIIPSSTKNLDDKLHQFETILVSEDLDIDSTSGEVADELESTLDSWTQGIFESISINDDLVNKSNSIEESLEDNDLKDITYVINEIIKINGSLDPVIRSHINKIENDDKQIVKALVDAENYNYFKELLKSPKFNDIKLEGLQEKKVCPECGKEICECNKSLTEEEDVVNDLVNIDPRVIRELSEEKTPDLNKVLGTTANVLNQHIDEINERCSEFSPYSAAEARDFVINILKTEAKDTVSNRKAIYKFEHNRLDKNNILMHVYNIILAADHLYANADSKWANESLELQEAGGLYGLGRKIKNAATAVSDKAKDLANKVDNKIKTDKKVAVADEIDELFKGKYKVVGVAKDNTKNKSQNFNNYEDAVKWCVAWSKNPENIKAGIQVSDEGLFKKYAPSGAKSLEIFQFGEVAKSYVEDCIKKAKELNNKASEIEASDKALDKAEAKAKIDPISISKEDLVKRLHARKQDNYVAIVNTMWNGFNDKQKTDFINSIFSKNESLEEDADEEMSDLELATKLEEYKQNKYGYNKKENQLNKNLKK